MSEELTKREDNAVSTEADYNPTDTIKRVAKVQNALLDVVGQMDLNKLLDDPKKMEQVNSLMANMNTTAVQVTRNSIVESNTDVGNIADAVMERFNAIGKSPIRTVEDTGSTGRIPQDIIIPNEGFEEIQDGMLQRGLIEQVYDDFAEANGLAKTED